MTTVSPATPPTYSASASAAYNNGHGRKSAQQASSSAPTTRQANNTSQQNVQSLPGPLQQKLKEILKALKENNTGLAREIYDGLSPDNQVAIKEHLFHVKEQARQAISQLYRFIKELEKSRLMVDQFLENLPGARQHVNQPA